MSKPPKMDDSDHEDLVAFLDGELEGDEARLIERRLNLDPTVRAEVDAYKRTWDLLDYLPRPQASNGFTEKTLTKVAALPKAPSSERWSWTYWRWPAWAAALGIAWAIGFMSQRLVSHQPGERELVRDLRLIENKRYYDLVDSDMEFVEKLAADDLFGDEKP